MPTDLKEKSADDLERQLWIASRRYMRGDISMEELEEIEDNHFSQLRRAILTLAEQRERWHPLNPEKPRKWRVRLKRAGKDLHTVLLALLCM